MIMIFRSVHKLMIKKTIAPFLIEPIEPVKAAADSIWPGRKFEIEIPARIISIKSVAFDRFDIEIN